MQVQYPARGGWHSDQSYRAPPPDASLLFCVAPALAGQGDTLFASNAAAFEALSPADRALAERSEMLHCVSTMGRSWAAAIKNPGVGSPPRSDRPAAALRPQRQPVVRCHPITGRR